MAVEKIAHWTKQDINQINIATAAVVDVAAGESLFVFVATKHDGADRTVASVTWDLAGVNEALAQVKSGTVANLHTAWWALLAPTPLDNKGIKVTLSAITHACAFVVVTVSGLLDLTLHDSGTQNFAWVIDWAKNQAGLNDAHFMFATANHVRDTGNWAPDELTEICEVSSDAGANQKALLMAVCYKQCDDADLDVGGDMSVERTGHLQWGAFAPAAPAAHNPCSWIM